MSTYNREHQEMTDSHAEEQAEREAREAAADFKREQTPEEFISAIVKWARLRETDHPGTVDRLIADLEKLRALIG